MSLSLAKRIHSVCRLKIWSFLNAVSLLAATCYDSLMHSSAVDVAIQQRDPHRRIAFVAAFAMSNYSSTIGRIAKPFNPMLVRTLNFSLNIYLHNP